MLKNCLFFLFLAAAPLLSNPSELNAKGSEASVSTLQNSSACSSCDPDKLNGSNAVALASCKCGQACACDTGAAASCNCDDNCSCGCGKP